MQVYLDGRALSVSGATLQAALDAVIAEAGARMVVEALADGETVPAAHLENPPDTSPYAAEMKFRSSDARTVVSVALHEAADIVEGVRRSQACAADQVRSGRVDEALVELRSTVEGWSSVRAAIDMLAGGGLVSTAHAGDDGRSLDALLNTLSGGLAELKRSIADADWASLGDVLAYDLEEQAERIGAWIRAVAELAADDVEESSKRG